MISVPGIQYKAIVGAGRTDSAQSVAGRDQTSRAAAVAEPDLFAARAGRPGAQAGGGARPRHAVVGQGGRLLRRPAPRHPAPPGLRADRPADARTHRGLGLRGGRRPDPGRRPGRHRDHARPRPSDRRVRGAQVSENPWPATPYRGLRGRRPAGAGGRGHQHHRQLGADGGARRSRRGRRRWSAWPPWWTAPPAPPRPSKPRDCRTAACWVLPIWGWARPRTHARKNLCALCARTLRASWRSALVCAARVPTIPFVPTAPRARGSANRWGCWAGTWRCRTCAGTTTMCWSTSTPSPTDPEGAARQTRGHPLRALRRAVASDGGGRAGQLR